VILNPTKDDGDWESYTTEAPKTTSRPYTTTNYYVSTDTYYYSEQKELAPAKPRQHFLGHNETYFGDFSAPLQIQGGKATLNFLTDSIAIMRGFKLRIEAVTCNDVQTGSGAIFSPDWPDHYSHNQECKYTLIAEPGKHIIITFHEFHLEKSRHCLHDSLTIMGRRYCSDNSDENNSPYEGYVIPAGSTVITWITNDSVRKSIRLLLGIHRQLAR
jgi:hypothetical protein